MASKNSVTKTVTSKYTMELSFLGTADDQQVEEEVVAILKRNFLAKMSSCKPESGALGTLQMTSRYKVNTLTVP